MELQRLEVRPTVRKSGRRRQRQRSHKKQVSRLLWAGGEGSGGLGDRGARLAPHYLSRACRV